MTLKVIDN